MLAINLLPPEEKHAGEKEKIRRTMVFFVMLAVIALLADILALVPSYLFVMAEEHSLQEALRLERASALRSGLDDALRAAQRNEAALDVVRAFAAKTGKIKPLAERIFSGNPGIAITQFTVKKQGSVAANGVASTREDLLGFESALRDFNRFDSVMIPLSDIIQDKDIHFSVQAQLKSDSRL